MTDVPESDNFDLTLIITLLKNLPGLTAPDKGYECLPISAEITPASDLARIKYYRNYLAHLKNSKIDDTFFDTAWNEMSQVCRKIRQLK